ncbi:hypothetical protein [Gymnodinialimonas hymeniacidonis]|uniref:hypothetical protein n=1 Tax=Gymnodinialimonas hymeniacidonis TaxID=3126508 RepID=UPI0034C5E2F3
MMNRCLVTCALMLASIQPAAAQAHPPEAVASAILTAFTNRDVAGIGAHANAFNADIFAAFASGEAPSDSVFNGLEGRAAVAWDGLILPARYTADGTAVIPFAIEVGSAGQPLNSGADGRYIAVFLTLDGPEDQSWGIDDLNFVQRGAYLSYTEAH